MSDPWQPLRRLTAARIALGRTGGSLPTGALLDFRLAHARARDAVLAPFDSESLAARLRRVDVEVLEVTSDAATRAEFLRRPDRGRVLSDGGRRRLTARAADPANVGCDLAVIVSDGLSSLAATEQAPPLLEALLPLARCSGWRLAPLVIATHGRVALQDEIGAVWEARLSLMLLGERPGLGAVNSLGAYLTYAPCPGLSDANRNCVSNIRAEGLPPVEAAGKLFQLLSQAMRRKLSGIELKDDAPSLESTAAGRSELCAGHAAPGPAVSRASATDNH